MNRYEALGITGNRATLVTGIYNVVGPLANLVFIVFLLDRVGRRRPLMFGALGITLALVCEAAINSQNEDGTRHGYSIGGVFLFFCVTVIFSFSFGPVSWVYMSEIMPMQIRGKGNAFATGIGNWAVSTLWSQVSPIALGEIGWKFYFVFAGWSESLILILFLYIWYWATGLLTCCADLVVTIPTIYLLFKETKQKTLEEIDLLFGGRALGTLSSDLSGKGLGPAQGEAVQVEKVEKAPNV